MDIMEGLNWEKNDRKSEFDCKKEHRKMMGYFFEASLIFSVAIILGVTVVFSIVTPFETIDKQSLSYILGIGCAIGMCFYCILWGYKNFKRGNSIYIRIQEIYKLQELKKL